MTDPGPLSWYVLHTKPREEDRAERNLHAWGIETLAPRVREPVYRRSSRETHVIKALFPQYLFARFNLTEGLAKIRFTRGVRSVVTIGGSAAPVPDDVIELLRARMGAGGLVQLEDNFRPGDPVMIQSGYLRGFEGVFQRGENGDSRVTILLHTLECRPRVVIDRARLRKLREHLVRPL